LLGDSAVRAQRTLLGEHDVSRVSGASDEQWRSARLVALRALAVAHRASDSRSGHDLMIAVASSLWRVTIALYLRDNSGSIGRQVWHRCRDFVGANDCCHAV